MSEKSYCNWCDSQTGSIVKEYKHGVLIWVGCIDCFTAKTEMKKKDA